MLSTQRVHHATENACVSYATDEREEEGRTED